MSQLYLAKGIMQILNTMGYEAYLVGGALRNELYNKYIANTKYEKILIKDYDVTTNATYEQVYDLFIGLNKYVIEPRGADFKVAVVKLGVDEVEVASYRGESYPEDGSLRPNETHYVTSFEEDTKRRDFTINAMGRGLNDHLIDFHNGFEDLIDKKIRCVGDPNERFQEDPLRMLRAVRFAAQLGFSIEYNTREAINVNVGRLVKVPHTRVADEINKIIMSKNPEIGFDYLRKTGLLGASFMNTLQNQAVPLLPQVNPDNAQNITDNLDLLQYRWAKLLEGVDYLNAAKMLNNLMPMNADMNNLVVKALQFSLMPNYKGVNDFKVHVAVLVRECRNRDELDRIYTMIKDVFYPKEFNILRLYRYTIFETILTERPLFARELPLNGNELCEITGKKPGPWIGKLQELALRYALNMKRYDELALKEKMINLAGI